MNKLKVQTSTKRNKQEKENKIKEILTKYPEGLTPKYVALYTKIPHNSVKGMLTRGISGIEQVPGLNGVYRLVANLRDNSIFSYNFHNLILGVFLPNYKNETVKQTLSCDLTNFEFIIGKDSKRATMRISTPKIQGTDYPINVSSITLAFALFRELVFKFARIDVKMKDVQVNSIEFNRDYSNLKLEGVNCITIENLVEQFKIYQKSDKLRTEHKIKIPMNAEELIKLLGIKND
jgi:hypothetical protein